MRSSVFGKWVLKFPIKAHILMPALAGLALMGLYFSHVLLLQSFVAPPVNAAGQSFMGGLGALRIVQAFILLCTMFFLGRGLIATRSWPARVVLVLLLLAVVSITLEELDFGTSLASLISGQPLYAPAADGSFDPSQAAGEQIAGLIKLGASAAVLALFVLAPLLMAPSRNRTVKMLAPSYWVLATVAVAVVISRLAAMLNNAGLGEIQGVPGALTHDIAEFGELIVYFLLLVYAAALHERIIAREEAWELRRGVISP